MITKVLLLTKFGRSGASSRVRCLQYIPELERHGVSVDCQSLINDDMLLYKYRNGKFPRLKLATAFIKRLSIIPSVRNYDVVWIQKEAFPYLPPVFDYLLLARAKKVVVDLDDAEFLKYGGKVRCNASAKMSYFSYFRKRNKFQMIFDRSSVVVVGNEFLKTMIQERYVSKFNILVVPTVVNTGKYASVVHEKRPGPLRVGWIGTPYTQQYLESVIESTKNLYNTDNFVLVVIGSNRKINGVKNIEFLDWSEETEIEDIRSLDVGLMPLSDGPWERGKCGYKAIQYMACGIPVVVSPVGINATIVEHDINGYHARTIKDWEKYLLLLSDICIRDRMGKANRLKIEENYSLNSQLNQLLGALVNEKVCSSI